MQAPLVEDAQPADEGAEVSKAKRKRIIEMLTELTDRAHDCEDDFLERLGAGIVGLHEEAMQPSTLYTQGNAPKHGTRAHQANMLAAGRVASRTGERLRDTFAARALERARRMREAKERRAPVVEEYQRASKRSKQPPFLGTSRDQMETILPGSSQWRGETAPF